MKAPSGESITRAVDVIVPVYNQRALVESCLASVLAAQNSAAHELIVVDDASTDPALKDHLAQLAGHGRIKLVTNPENKGFTKSVNLGMRIHPERDVVLLNSDTVVYGSWLDRLRMAAYSDLMVATVNPLTNASHIGCYPYRAANGDVAFEISDQELDRLASEANKGRFAHVHTTVGFCMYIKRAALDSVGYFDEVHFPIGYGEESDFCYRAAKIGWKHLIAGDTFVRHWEGQSFGERKARLISEMLTVFQRLHPDLADKDAGFRQRDPVRPLRLSLDLARITRMLGGRSRVRGVVDQQEAEEGGEEVCVIYSSSANTLRFFARPAELFPNLPLYQIPSDLALFNSAAQILGIQQIVFADDAEARSLSAAASGLPFEVKLKVGIGTLAAVSEESNPALGSSD